MKKKICILFFIITILTLFTGCIKINLKGNPQEKSNSIKKQSNVLVEDKKTKNEKDSKNENSSNSKIIVLDPGHSSTGTSGNEPISPNSSKTKLKDGLGATGIYTNIPEYETNMSIALLLKNQLELKGYHVILTKNSVNKSISNIERAQIGNKNNANLVVRIHVDSCEDSSVNGASIHIPANNEYTSNFYEVSKYYGKIILDTYTNKVGIRNRGVIERNDLTGFNWSKVPVVLIEMGFLSNKEDDMFVSDIENHTKIAQALGDGIDKCFH